MRNNKNTFVIFLLTLCLASSIYIPSGAEQEADLEELASELINKLVADDYWNTVWANNTQTEAAFPKDADISQNTVISHALEILLRLNYETIDSISRFSFMGLEFYEWDNGSREWVISMGTDTGASNDGYIFNYDADSGQLKKMQFGLGG